MTAMTGRAPTAHASKYLQQLSKHWSHKNSVVFDALDATIALGDNRIGMHAEPEALIATLTPGPLEDPARLQRVFEAHINRFAFREAPLDFKWQNS